MLLIAVALACLKPQTGVAMPTASNLTLAKRVFASVGKHCANCHSGAKNSTFALRSRDDLFRYARGMAGEVLKLRMPPGTIQGDFGSFCLNGGLGSSEVADYWEWSNRVEQNRIKLFEVPKAVRYQMLAAVPKPDLIMRIPVAIPAEAPDGLHSFTRVIKISKAGLRLNSFWVETNLPARVLTAKLTTSSGDFLTVWSVGTRHWSYGRLGPEMPPRATIALTSSINGEKVRGAARLCFGFSLVGDSYWNPVRQSIQSNSPVQTKVLRAGQLLGFYPVFGANVESWRARLWQPQSGWKVIAGHPSATSRSIGAYIMSKPISLSPGDLLETEVRYRRGRVLPISTYWAISQPR